MDQFSFAPDLTPSDVIVLRNLADDVQRHKTAKTKKGRAEKTQDAEDHEGHPSSERDALDIALLQSLNDPSAKAFEPSVFTTVDLRDISAKSYPEFISYALQTYIWLAQTIVRHKTDVIMLTHLILYFSTTVPSALLLFYRFSYLHGVLHFAMQGYYMGPYTLMRHQHIHMGGVLAKKPIIEWFDFLFPYLTDPLMGHTWNSYFYHHVKHHHVEGNGPNDLSSTVRYQRDDIFHFLHYLGRFFFFVWLDLPRYFLKAGRTTTAAKAAGWELSSYAMLCIMFYLNRQATTFVLLLPLLLMRLSLMIGNWGQHAFVDPDDPQSDYRSSITLIDVPSNRFCFNDGYHTSHHLNPRRHWRDHPVHFLQQKGVYAKERALVFHNIDYLMITFNLMRKNYDHLASCLVPIGGQIDMTMEERVAMLKGHTRPLSEEEICQKFQGYKSK